MAGWAWLELHQLAIFRVDFHVAEMAVDIRWITRWHEPRQQPNSTGWDGIYGKTFIQITEYLPTYLPQ